MHVCSSTNSCINNFSITGLQQVKVWCWLTFDLTYIAFMDLHTRNNSIKLDCTFSVALLTADVSIIFITYNFKYWYWCVDSDPDLIVFIPNNAL